MTAIERIREEIESLAEYAEENGEKAMASVLYAVLGSTHDGSTETLMHVISSHSQSQLRKLRGMQQ